jgi:hypothetical protein
MVIESNPRSWPQSGTKIDTCQLLGTARTVPSRNITLGELIETASSPLLLLPHCWPDPSSDRPSRGGDPTEEMTYQVPEMTPDHKEAAESSGEGEIKSA